MYYLQQLLNEGGAVMYLIFACAFFTLFIVFERLYHLYRAQIDVDDMIEGLCNVVRNQSALEAAAICKESPGPAAHVARAAILSADANESVIQSRVEEVMLIEISRLEKHMKLLATIAMIAPLLGLLGTVVGLIQTFESMQGDGRFVETVVLAANIKLALVTTAAGLCVSIFAYAFYNFLVTRIDSIVTDMKKTAAEVIILIHYNPIEFKELSQKIMEKPDEN